MEAPWVHEWKHGDQEGGCNSNSGERRWGEIRTASEGGESDPVFSVKVELIGPTLRVHIGEEGRRGIMGDA